MNENLFSRSAEYPSNRLFCLDALRGLDMILLTVVGPLICAAQDGWNCFPAGFVRQFYHGWRGFTLWDIIMPLFIFMCGAAMPFALEKRLRQGRGVFWRHVLARVALLWFLGGLVQGQWMTLDPLKMTPYSNTLQSIAMGYLVVAAAMATGSRILMYVGPLVLAVGYAMLMAIHGDYSQFGNVAYDVDQAVFRFMLPSSSRWIVNPSYYTWVLTSAMFAVMTFVGYHATIILRSSRTNWIKAGLLCFYGAALLGGGLVSEIWVPCIKPIFTFSFTAQAMGWCALALDLLFVVNDIWRIRCGSTAILFFGQMALAAYFTSHFFKPVLESFAHLMVDGILARIPCSAEPFVICLLSIVGMVVLMIGWCKVKS